jgi:Cu2+-exporting ATPase
MDCENGKIYLEKGKCPVCEMELVASTEAAAESDEGHEGHDHDSHEGHNH